MSTKSTTAESDAVLLTAWRAGDTSAGEQLVRNNYALVERFLINKVGPEKVSDLAQETFPTCVDARDCIRDDSRFRSFLVTIAYRVFCAHLRQEYRAGTTLDFDQLSVEDTRESPSSLFGRQREQRLLLESLRSISVNYQVVLELYYWEDLSTVEIGEVLGVPAATARTRLRRARDALTAAIESKSRSPKLLHSTMTRLEDWAARCRRELGG